MDVLDRPIDPRELGRRLREARSARGMTQEEVAGHLDIARTTLTAIEKGDRGVRPEELSRLAALYGRKLSELLRAGEAVEGFAVQLRSQLGPRGPVDVDLLPVIEDLERLCSDYVELERVTGASLPRRYPPAYSIEGVDPEQAAEDVASAERNRLGFGDGPLLSLRSVLESDVGLRVFYPEMPSRIAGMFAYTEELGGCIAINRKHPPERRRHSMGHEYGHFLTDRFRSEVTVLGRFERRPASERFAETFARAFLMPASGLRRRFHEVVRSREAGATPGDVCRLAHFYFVSVEAMTRRLEELSMIPRGTWERLELQGFKVRQAQRLLGLQERPDDEALFSARYRYLAIEAWHRAEISEGQLAAFLRVDRLQARELVQRIELDGGDGDAGLDLATPLTAAS